MPRILDIPGRRGQELMLDGKEWSLSEWRAGLKVQFEETQGLLKRLLFGNDASALGFPEGNLVDNAGNKEMGYSFLTDPKNRLAPLRNTLLTAVIEDSAMKAKYFHQSTATGQPATLLRGAAQDYLLLVRDFIEHLYTMCHLTYGQPGRGTEMSSLAYQNTKHRARNVFVVGNRVLMSSEYHKSASAFGRYRLVLRAVPIPVGQLLLHYLVFVKPFEIMCQRIVCDTMTVCNSATYLFHAGFKVMDTDAITAQLKQFSTRHLSRNASFGIADIRHITTHMMRIKLLTENGEPIVDAEGQLVRNNAGEMYDAQAGHTTDTAEAIYGVQEGGIPHVAADKVAAFTEVSDRWCRVVFPFGAPSYDAVQDPERKSTVKQQTIIQIDSKNVDSLGIHIAEAAKPDFVHMLSQAVTAIIGRSLAAVEEGIDSGRLLVDAKKQYGANDATQLRADSPVVVTPSHLHALHMLLGRPADVVRFRSPEQGMAVALSTDANIHSLIVLPTGGGKSFVYQIPGYLERTDSLVTLVVVPFIALKKESILKTQSMGITCIAWAPNQRNTFATITFMSMEHAASDVGTNALIMLHQQRRLRRIVLEEASTVLTDAHWRPVMNEAYKLATIGVQLIALTATLQPGLGEEQLRRNLRINAWTICRAPTAQRHIFYDFIMNDKRSVTLDAAHSKAVELKSHLAPTERGLIFVQSIKAGEQLAKDMKLPFYHAQLDEKARQSLYDEWVASGTVMIATLAFAFGIDFPRVRFVIIIELPTTLTTAYQMWGRSGRDGRTSTCLLYATKGLKGWNKDQEVSGGQREIEGLVLPAHKPCLRAIAGSFFDARPMSCAAYGPEYIICGLCLPAFPRPLQGPAPVKGWPLAVQDPERKRPLPVSSPVADDQSNASADGDSSFDMPQMQRMQVGSDEQRRRVLVPDTPAQQTPNVGARPAVNITPAPPTLPGERSQAPPLDVLSLLNNRSSVSHSGS